MSITLAKGLETAVLPDLYWSDELRWTETEAKDERSITGKLLRQTSTKQGGRSITLVPPDEAFGRLPLATLRTLRGWTDDPDAQMTLTLANGDVFSVLWRYPDPIADAKPVYGHTDRDGGELWTATLNLVTTSP